MIHTSLTCAWHSDWSDWFYLNHRCPIHAHSSQVPSSNSNPRSCSCKVRSLFVFLLVTSFMSLCLVGYQNHVSFFNRTMVPVLIYPWLPYDVCCSSPKLARSVVTCILLMNWQAWQSGLFVHTPESNDIWHWYALIGRDEPGSSQGKLWICYPPLTRPPLIVWSTASSQGSFQRRTEPL
jgi:hypothetical protein